MATEDVADVEVELKCCETLDDSSAVVSITLDVPSTAESVVDVADTVVVGSIFPLDSGTDSVVVRASVVVATVVSLLVDLLVEVVKGSP